MYEVKRFCWLTNKTEAMRLPVTQEQVDAWLAQSDAPFVQDAFPGLTSEQREFVLTGTTPTLQSRAYAADG